MIDHRGAARWTGPLSDGDILVNLADVDEAVAIGLDECTIRLSRQRRPRWAEQFEQRQGSGRALIRWPDGEPLWMDPSQLMRYGLIRRDRSWRLEMDAVGPLLHLGLVSPQAHLPTTADRIPDVTVDFRWIPHGRFWMGTERGDGDPDEHPKHVVTVTQGFWLADTPCTQALWQAVMGNNPSHFKDHTDATERPVEKVSWNDVQAFLASLNRQLRPGVEAVLPTEAQWEYACRAGSDSAYAWGDDFDAARANVNHGEGALKKTSVVKRYEPNAWGLYDMHGNVWEWCADGKRDYSPELQTDPRGPEGPEVPRVLRGGSWVNHPAFARSASRYRVHPGLRRLSYGGFRLALRSPSPGPGGQGVQGVLAGGQRASAAAAEPARPTQPAKKKRRQGSSR